MEKQCKWHFKDEGGRDVGPNDPVDEKFKGQPYYSIVREAIQNSLDAVKNDNEPVKIVFSFSVLHRNDFPSFFKIEEHLKLCKDFYSGNDNAKKLFTEMLDFLNGREIGLKKASISCMKISDYNTKGMSYDSENTNSPFYAFLRAGGVSAKAQGSGGSFGFGKGAYYTLSPIKTIIVSTKDDRNNVYFEGSTILTTHKAIDGKKLTAYGYYDNNNGEPINNYNEIPDFFKRNEIGTDISIIGLWEEPGRNNLMIKSVLNNFWLSIYERKLIVQVDNVEINKESLDNIIDKYFDDEIEKRNNIEDWNPKPYFKAVKYSRSSEQFHFFEEELEILGKVKLYVYLDKNLPNRISYFRKPKMVVYKKTNNKILGYAAVFVCESEKGNEILRSMENAAHNEWKKENYPKDQGHIINDARKAEFELGDFVNSKLESLSHIKSGNKISILGLEDYLSIPEDLIEKDEELEFQGDGSSNTSGTPNKEYSEEDTGLQTTEKTEPLIIIPSIKIQSRVKEESSAKTSEIGDKIILTRNNNDSDEGGSNSDKAGSSANNGIVSLDQIASRVLVYVNFRLVAQKEFDEMYHILIINSLSEIVNAELELIVGSDNDREDGLDVVFSDKGKVQRNTINNCSLKSGINKVKIRFADNMKHSIKLKAYEIK